MGMFDMYDNLQDYYVPNNLRPCPPKPCDDKLIQECVKKPYEEYNAEGKLIGYYWYYGDTINLEFNIDGDIIVEDNAIIYTAINETPTEQTSGVIGQKAYNVIDLKSWTCTAIDSLNNTYTWTEDSQFTNPESGDRNIYVTAQDFMKDKQVTVELYNFRREPIITKTYAGSTQIIFAIDKDISKQLVRGVYYCSLTVWSGEELSRTILYQEECSLNVK